MDGTNGIWRVLCIFALLLCQVPLWPQAPRPAERKECTIEFHEFLETEELGLTKVLRLEMRNKSCEEFGFKIKLDFVPMEQPSEMSFSYVGNPTFIEIPKLADKATAEIRVTASERGGPARLVAHVLDKLVELPATLVKVVPDSRDVVLQF